MTALIVLPILTLCAIGACTVIGLIDSVIDRFYPPVQEDRQ